MNHKKLSILIIAEEVNYDRSSCGLINAKIIHSLSGFHQCDVLTEGVIPKDFKNFHQGKLIHFYFKKPRWLKWLGNIPVARRMTTYVYGINHASFHKFLQWKKQIANCLPGCNYDVVLLLPTGMGYYAHQAWAELPDSGIPSIIEILDPYPMALLPPPLNSKWDFGEKLLVRRFKKLIAQSRSCWSSSLRQLEWMYDVYPALKEKSVVIPHLAMKPPFDNALRHAEENELTKLLPGLHTKDVFLFVHMGTLLRGRNPQFLFDAFTRWLADHPEAAKHSKMVFVGNIQRDIIASFEPVLQHPNFICSLNTRISYQQALLLQQNATANLVIESLEKVSPQLFGKFADAVLADRVIMCIGPETSEARRLLGAGYPYQATNGNSLNIYKMIDALYASWQSNHTLTLNRPDLQHAFHPDRVLDAMQKTIG